MKTGTMKFKYEPPKLANLNGSRGGAICQYGNSAGVRSVHKSSDPYEELA